MDKPKRKSQRRFEQINLLCDEVLRCLPNPVLGLLLIVGWRHADQRGVFRKSMTELSRFTGISRRQVQRLIDELIAVGALKVVKPQRGTIPTSYLITGKPRPSDDTHVTTKQNASDDK